MNGSARRQFRLAAVIVTIAAPAVSHIALTLGQGYGVAVALAVIQAVASGAVLATSLPTTMAMRTWVGALVSLSLLLALALGARHGGAVALLAMAGAAHALLYTGLLLVFANSLRPGHIALATWFASRLNPSFHAGMVPYTRKVTLAWTLLFAGQLALSGALLAADVPLWQTFVTILHIPLVILLVLTEAIIRRWRWRHEHATSLMDTIRGTRRLMRRG